MRTPVHPATRPSGEPRLASVASWAVLAASFGLSASTWIALARLAGFTATATVPGAGLTLAMAWLMPIAVDGYVVVALVLWMAPVPARVAAFARKNTYGAAGIGIAAQSAYHLLYTLATTDQAWRVVLAAIVGALPPAVAALAVHMRALIRRETTTRTTATPLSVPATTPTPDQPSDLVSAVPALPATTSTPTTSPTATSNPTEPALVPEPSEPPVVTPADVAPRITKPRPTGTPAEPAAAPVRAARPRRPRPTAPATPASTLAPSTTDTPVSASDAAQPTLPVVRGDLLARARQVATQYRTEHGTPITPGQLAVRLRVTSEQATGALAVLDLGPDSPTQPIPTVNGRPVKATR